MRFDLFLKQEFGSGRVYKYPPRQIQFSLSMCFIGVRYAARAPSVRTHQKGVPWLCSNITLSSRSAPETCSSLQGNPRAARDTQGAVSLRQEGQRRRSTTDNFSPPPASIPRPSTISNLLLESTATARCRLLQAANHRHHLALQDGAIPPMSIVTRCSSSPRLSRATLTTARAGGQAPRAHRRYRQFRQRHRELPEWPKHDFQDVSWGRWHDHTSPRTDRRLCQPITSTTRACDEQIFS